MLENTEGAIKKGQSRENLEIHNTICAGHHHTKTHKQLHHGMCLPTNNWRQKRTEHCKLKLVLSIITTHN